MLEFNKKAILRGRVTLLLEHMGPLFRKCHLVIPLKVVMSRLQALPVLYSMVFLKEFICRCENTVASYVTRCFRTKKYYAHSVLQKMLPI